MSNGKSSGYFNGHIAGLVGGEFAFVFQHAGKGSTLHKLHCNEIRVVYFAPIVNSNDVGV